MHSKKRHLLVKTRKMDGASSFRTSEERSESGQPGDAQSSRPGSGVGDDPFARAPLTVVKTMKKAVSIHCFLVSWTVTEVWI